MKKFFNSNKTTFGWVAAGILILGRLVVGPWAQSLEAAMLSKFLFLVGVSVLTAIAFSTPNSVLKVLQIKILFGAVTNAVLPDEPTTRVILNLVVALVGVRIALSDPTFKSVHERWAFFVGMAFLAIGFGIGNSLPVVRDTLLSFGPWCISVARYSQRQNPVTRIWFWLNIATGLVSLLSLLGRI